MSIQQLRNLLFDKISGIQDEEFLKARKTILDSYAGEVEPYKFTKDQERAVLIGLEQIKKGEIISNEQLEKEEDEWLAE